MHSSWQCLQQINITSTAPHPKWQNNTLDSDFIKVMRMDHDQKWLIASTEMNDIQVYGLDQSLQWVSNRRMQDQVYDIEWVHNQYGHNMGIVSVQGMPISFYQLQEGHLVMHHQFIQYMVSSERYYNPLRMVAHNQSLYCAGKKFFIELDITRNTIKQDYRQNKTHLSTVAAQNDGAVVAVGTMDRQVVLLDKTNPKEKGVSLQQVHMSALTELQWDPMDNNRLISSARKDDCIYLWDIRKTDQFIGYITRPNNLNQRMFMHVQYNKIATGDQNGVVRVHTIDQNGINQQPELSLQVANTSVSNVLFYGKDKIISAHGQRSFNRYYRECTQGGSESEQEDQQYYQEQGQIKLWGRT